MPHRCDRTRHHHHLFVLYSPCLSRYMYPPWGSPCAGSQSGHSPPLPATANMECLHVVRIVPCAVGNRSVSYTPVARQVIINNTFTFDVVEDTGSNLAQSISFVRKNAFCACVAQNISPWFPRQVLKRNRQVSVHGLARYRCPKHPAVQFRGAERECYQPVSECYYNAKESCMALIGAT